MTIPDSHASAAVAFIFDAITTSISAETGHDLWIEYGEPLADDEGEPLEVEPDDQIYLVEVTNAVAPFAMVGSMGAGALSETIGIEFAVKVQREEADASTAFNRCVSLINAIVSAVRTDPTLGGAVLKANPTTVHYPPPTSANNGTRRICETSLTISCFAID